MRVTGGTRVRPGTPWAKMAMEKTQRLNRMFHVFLCISENI